MSLSQKPTILSLGLSLRAPFFQKSSYMVALFEAETTCAWMDCHEQFFFLGPANPTVGIPLSEAWGLVVLEAPAAIVMAVAPFKESNLKRQHRKHPKFMKYENNLGGEGFEGIGWDHPIEVSGNKSTTANQVVKAQKGLWVSFPRSHGAWNDRLWKLLKRGTPMC